MGIGDLMKLTLEMLRKAKAVLDNTEPPPYPRYAALGNIIVRIKSPEDPPEYLDENDEWKTLTI